MRSATGSCSSHVTLTCSDAIHEGLKSNLTAQNPGSGKIQ